MIIQSSSSSEVCQEKDDPNKETPACPTSTPKKPMNQIRNSDRRIGSECDVPLHAPEAGRDSPSMS
jgi:hypothetical protein